MMIRLFLKRIVDHGVPLLCTIGFLILSCDYLVQSCAKPFIYASTNDIPHNKVGLVLGTGKILSNGHVNKYYAYRINAAEELYKSGKVDFLLISGDNSTEYYDEPTTIKQDLVARGIPANKIVLDYAGFRTLDSMVRCKLVFGETSVTVISQPFHNERAVFLGRQFNMEAIGFNAQSVSSKYGFRTQLREKLARVKVMIDLLFGVDPKFLGDHIEIK